MKKVFLYIVIALILLAIPATVYFVGQQRDIRTRAAPATTLTITPATPTMNVGDTIKLNIDIDPATNQVVSADIYITYDATKLDATTITNGINAPRVLTSGVIENGTASIKVGAASNAQPITTPGTIAVLTLTAKDATSNFAPAVVSFASNTFVGGLNEPTANVLVSTTPSKISINGTSTTGGTNFATESAGLNTSISPTATPTPTLALTPTLPAGESTNSALQILTPTSDSDTTNVLQTISGKAPAGSTVTIVIHSDTAQTVTVTADANGNWIYTPTTALDAGPHNVVASTVNSDGTVQTSAINFVVIGTGGSGSSESAMPISGNVETTLLLIGIGLLFITSGALIPIFIR